MGNNSEGCQSRLNRWVISQIASGMNRILAVLAGCPVISQDVFQGCARLHAMGGAQDQTTAWRHGADALAHLVFNILGCPEGEGILHVHRSPEGQVLPVFALDLCRVHG